MCPAPGRSLSRVFQAVVWAAEHGQPCDAEGQAAAPLLQCSPPSYVRAGVVVWWMPGGSAFHSQPSFLRESERAELELLNKPDRIQGSRCGSPLRLPQKCGEEKLLRVLQGIV